MKATFEERPSIRPRDVDKKTGAVKLVEYVSIHTGHNGRDVVHRPATDDDRQRFAAEYRAFRPPPVEEEVAPASPAPEGALVPEENLTLGLPPGPASDAVAEVAPPPSPEAFEELALDELP